MFLRALLALAVVLHGTAIPAVDAAGIAPNAAAHADHHGPDHLSDHATAGDSADSPTADCCDGKACDCGCNGSQVIPLPVTATPRSWARAPAVFALVSAPFG